MASESVVSEVSAALERLLRSRHVSSLLPFILGFSSSPEAPETQQEPDQTTDAVRSRVILINPATQGMVVVEGSPGLDSLLRDLESKAGPAPAAKSAIEALPRVEITRDCGGGDGDEECSICLDEFEAGGVVKEMPCKHRFHGECINRWLGMRGSCPVCRHQLPVEAEAGKRRISEREIWVSISVNGSNRSPSSDREEDASSNGDEVEG